MHIPMCRFDSDQTFSSLQGTTLETMNVVDGTWYVYLKGDYAGRVSGAVYDLRNSMDPVKLVTTVRRNVSLYCTACLVRCLGLHVQLVKPVLYRQLEDLQLPPSMYCSVPLRVECV